MRILGLINARKGSQGVPGKNTKRLDGKPLIGWTVETACACPSLSRIVVSTDCNQIAEIAQRFGADIPFMRPSDLAGPTSLQIDTIRYVMERLEREEHDHYDAVAVLQPTTPLRSVQDVEGCIAMMVEKNSDTVITVVRKAGSLLDTLYGLSKDNVATPQVQKQDKGTIRQNLPETFLRVGAVYLIRRDTVLEKGRLYGDIVHAYEIPHERAFDIDTPFDWNLLDAWIKHGKPTRTG